MLGSLCPADCLDSTHICLNNPENCQKTSRTDTLEPSVDKRLTEEGRKGREEEAERVGRAERWCAQEDWQEVTRTVEGHPAGEPLSLACKSGRTRRSVF